MPITLEATKTVTAAGTAEALVSSNTMITWCVIQPLSTNTGYVFIGDLNVSSTRGMWLDAALGQSLTLPEASVPLYIDLATVFVDAAVNGEGVNILYGKR